MSSGKVLPTITENVHFEKYLGIAKITKQDALKFCKKYKPEQYDAFKATIREDEYPLTLCIENIFKRLEELPPYKILESIIVKSKIDSFEEKIWLSCFVVIQELRGHTFIKELQQGLDSSKFESLVMLRWMLEDQKYLMSEVLPLTQSKWFFYLSENHKLPLSDSPVLYDENSIMIALSPRLLLKISLNEKSMNADFVNYSVLSEEIYLIYRDMLIKKAFKDIIFHDRNLLEEWAKLPEFLSRKEEVSQKFY